VSELVVYHGKIFSSSYDSTIKVWYPEFDENMPPALKPYLTSDFTSNISIDELPKDSAGRTALMLCARNGNWPNAKTLLGHGHDINEVSPYGETAIFFALRYGELIFYFDM
jgi:ankyrin repeat protein